MTNKEKTNIRMMAWRMARRFNRAEERGDSEEKLNGMFDMMTTVGLDLGIDFTDMLIAVKNGETFEDYFMEQALAVGEADASLVHKKNKS